MSFQLHGSFYLFTKIDERRSSVWAGLTHFAMVDRPDRRVLNVGNMLYGLRVYSALSQLGLRPTTFGSKYRVFMRRAGRVLGNSPQEVALFMVAQLPTKHRFHLRPAVIKTWIRKRKIDPAADQVRAALTALDL